MLPNKTSFRYFLAIALGMGVAVCGIFFDGNAQAPAQNSVLPARIDYNWDVRPILSDNCFRCHGPDEKARQAGLRLDTAATAYSVISRGKPADSELVNRISSTDPDYRMPPPGSHKQLSETQIAILKKWIEQGAEYKSHWALIAPKKTSPPNTKSQGRVVNDIDRFVF